MKKTKRVLLAVLLFVLFSIAFGFGWNAFVSYHTKPYIFTHSRNLPTNHVGLVLGTAPYNRSGHNNLYFTNRIAATAKLYKRGRIKYVLVSGDNGTVYYNEPQAMEEQLVQSGIPQSHIVKDFAGFRTLDSMVRAKKVFGQKKITIITQAFHAERAVFIARHYGIDAVGYCAKDAPAYYGFKTKVREYFARIKMFIDLYILRTEPKFLGDKIRIPH